MNLRQMKVPEMTMLLLLICTGTTVESCFGAWYRNWNCRRGKGKCAAPHELDDTDATDDDANSNCGQEDTEALRERCIISLKSYDANTIKGHICEQFCTSCVTFTSGIESVGYNGLLKRCTCYPRVKSEKTSVTLKSARTSLEKHMTRMKNCDITFRLQTNRPFANIAYLEVNGRKCCTEVVGQKEIFIKDAIFSDEETAMSNELHCINACLNQAGSSTTYRAVQFSVYTGVTNTYHCACYDMPESSSVLLPYTDWMKTTQ